MIDLGTAVGYLMLDTTGFKQGFEEANDQLKTFQDSSATMGDKLGAIGGAMTNVGSTLTKSVTLPLVGAGTALVKFASDGDSAMSQFRAKVGDVTGSMDEYRKVMDEVYKNNYGESYEDVANAMGEIVNRLGEMDPSQLQSVTESAFALRDTFEYDVGESVRSVDTLMKNFGLTSEEAFDYIAKGTQEGLDYSGEFLDTINEYSVQFGKLGFSADEMFAVLKQGAETGAWNLDKIGDAVKEFSIRAIDGSETTIAGFEALGFSADDMAARFAVGGDEARAAFDEVIQGLADMDDPVEQSIAGVNLFGTMWEDLGPEVVTQLADISGATLDAKGSMDQLKDVKYDNLEGALGGLSRSIQTAGASLGKYLIPKVESAIDFVDNVVSAFEGLDDGAKETIVNIGLVVAAIGPLLVIGGKISSAFSFLSSIASSISLVGSKLVLMKTALVTAADGAVGTMTTMQSLGSVLAGLVNPVTIVIAAVAALAAAWVTDFGGIREKTAEIFESIKAIFASAWEFISGLWNDNFLGIQDTAVQAFELIEKTFSGALDIIVDIFNVFAALFTGDWDGLWEAVKQLVSDVWNQVTGLFWDWLNLLVDTLIRIGVRLWEGAKQVFTDMKDGFVEVWDNIVDWFGRVIEDPVGTVKDIGSKLYEAGQDIFNSLWDGLSSIWDGIQDWVSDKVDWLVSKVKFWESESDKVSRSSFDGGQSGGGRSGGSYASGLDYVPRDMTVQVHQGETIYTKQESGDLLTEIRRLASSQKGNRPINLTVQIGERTIGSIVVDAANQETMANGTTVLHI